MKNTNTKTLYSAGVIEFTTVAAEFCRLVETANKATKDDFVCKALKILPLLYLKTSLLETVSTTDYDEEYAAERFVSEDDYRFVRETLAATLGNDDVYLETVTPEMQFSDVPVAAFISENLADVYQEIRDYLQGFQSGIEDAMFVSLLACLSAFVEHWGQKLLNALRALHALRYSENYGIQENDCRTVEDALFAAKYTDNFLEEE